MNEFFANLSAAHARHSVFWQDEASGLRAVLVIDDVTLGPAAGGIRTQPYPSLQDAILDAAELAQNMTRKCALAGLDAGGAKVVVLDHPGLNRKEAFLRLGERIEDLGGLFHTGPDLGTGAQDLDTMARATRYVNRDAGLPEAVARGLVGCLRACAAARGADGLTGLKIAIQGCGSIGAAAASALSELGAKLVLADVQSGRANALAEELGAQVCEAEKILHADVDIVAPCAVGGVLTRTRAEGMRAWALCGAANNILAEPAVPEMLMQRNILHVPDAIASAGAVVEGIGRTVMALDDRTHLLDGLGNTAYEVLMQARDENRTPLAVAEDRARERLRRARAARVP